MNDRKIRINELVYETGVPRTTIHFYIREGLLPPPMKTGKTMGYYDQGHVQRLEAIKAMKAEFTETSGKTRMPLDMLKQQMSDEGYYSTAKIGGEAGARRRGEEARAQRRKDIMDAALRLYAGRGYYQTGVRDIALEAGISPAAFYLYFQDKRELFVEIIEEVIGKLVEDTRAVVDEANNPFEKAVIMFYALHNNYARVGEVLNQLRAGVAVNDPWAMEKFKKIYDDLCEKTAAVIRDYIDQGVIRDVDADLLAYTFTALAEAAYQKASLDQGYTLEEVGILVFDWLINGVAKR